jgi:YtkA-like
VSLRSVAGAARLRRRTARAAVALLAACALGLASSACKQQKENELEVTLKLDPSPPRVGKTQVDLDLAVAGQPLTKAEVSVEGNMNHAGMVPVLAKATETAPGHYRANLEFTMGGDWFLLITAVTPDDRTLTRPIDVPGVALSGEH